MRDRTLARKARRQARRQARRGKISMAEYAAVMETCADPVKLAAWNKAIDEARLNPWENGGVLVGGSWSDMWSNIWDWFVANWPTILRILMTILPLLILEPEREDS